MIPKRCANCGRKFRTGRTTCDVCVQVRSNKEARLKAEAEAKANYTERIEQAVDQAEQVAEYKLKFLTALLQNGGHIEKACKTAGVGRTQMSNYRDDDPEFATAWEAVQETNIERLETEADRRALGYEIHEPLAYQGKLTGDIKVVQQFSDNLLMFRLKALRPEKYRDGPNVSARTGAQLSEQELNDALTKMMARRKSIKVDQVSEEVS